MASTTVSAQVSNGCSIELSFDIQAFELESAIRMAQYTLRTDYNPGLGPRADQPDSVELEASSRASDADWHGLLRERAKFP